MKRFHLSIAVTDLQRSVNFYTTLFAAAPDVLKQDYAKWMLDDPRINFSASVAMASVMWACRWTICRSWRQFRNGCYWPAR